MAVTHPSSVRNLIADTVTADLDGGSTFARLVLQAAGSTALVTLALASSAFGAASTGVCTANTITDGTVLVAGTAAIAILSAGTAAAAGSSTAETFRGSVTSTGGGGNIELSSNVLSTGQTVSISSMTYTSPA